LLQQQQPQGATRYAEEYGVEYESGAGATRTMEMEGMLEKVSGHTRRDPLQASQLIEAWMTPTESEGV
jgi:hypothetical protein